MHSGAPSNRDELTLAMNELEQKLLARERFRASMLVRAKHMRASERTRPTWIPAARTSRAEAVNGRKRLDAQRAQLAILLADIEANRAKLLQLAEETSRALAQAMDGMDRIAAIMALTSDCALPSDG